MLNLANPDERKKSKEQRRKQQVLPMISNGRPVREVAESLGIGENLIYRWQSRQESKGTAGKENVVVTTDQQALLRRIRELETERDMDPMLTHVCWFKEALTIFSRDLKEWYRFVSQHTQKWPLQVVSGRVDGLVFP